MSTTITSATPLVDAMRDISHGGYAYEFFFLQTSQADDINL
jgi:hypothetical protein